MISQTCLRKAVLISSAILVLSTQAAVAEVGVNLNINLGSPRVIAPPPQPVYVAPAPPPQPVYVAPAPPPQPVYVAPAPPVETVVVNDDVQFVYPDALGFYVAVGVPYDLFYANNSYFLFRDGRWLRAPSGRGPWVVQRFRDLPPALRRNRIERIREFRAREYAIYQHDRDHYRGRHFRSEKEQWKERQREAHEWQKEQKHLAKEQKHWDHERRKEEKRLEKEDRRERREGRD